MMPADVEGTARRLDNWGRWAGSGTGGERCASAERLYVPPREDEQRLIGSARDPIDPNDAMKVEAAICALARPADRRFLIEWYAQRKPKDVMARRHKIPHNLLEGNLTRLQAAVFYRLEHLASVPLAKRRTIEYRAIQQPNNLTTALGEQLALSRRRSGKG